MSTKVLGHTLRVHVIHDRLEEFASNLVEMGPTIAVIDDGDLTRARFEGEVDLMVDKCGDHVTAWVTNFPRSWDKLGGVYVKDFYYREEKRLKDTGYEGDDPLQDPEDPDYEQEPGDARLLYVSPTPAHMFHWYSWEGPFAERPFFHLPLKIKFVQGTYDAKYHRTKLTWDESYRGFVIKLP